MPSAVKQGMSQRICDPRNNSAEPRNGALGVRRRFCFARTRATGALSKIDTKLGIWLLLFHWSWSGKESSESGVALLDREPVLHVCSNVMIWYKVIRMTHQIVAIYYLTSTSRNTSRISGFFLVCLDLVLPRTVLFKALTLNFTASAWCFDNRANIGANSDVGCSRPFNKDFKINKRLNKIKCCANSSIFTRQSCQDMLRAADIEIN